MLAEAGGRVWCKEKEKRDERITLSSYMVGGGSPWRPLPRKYLLHHWDVSSIFAAIESRYLSAHTSLDDLFSSCLPAHC